MTEAKPTYSKNPIMDGVEHLGHWLHVAEHDVLGDTLHVIRDGLVVAEDFKAQFPTLAADAGAVAADLVQCKAIGAATAAVALGGGTNLAADAGFLAALATDAPQLIKAFADAAKLVETLTAYIGADTSNL